MLYASYALLVAVHGISKCLCTAIPVTWPKWQAAMPHTALHTNGVAYTNGKERRKQCVQVCYFGKLGITVKDITVHCKFINTVS